MRREDRLRIVRWIGRVLAFVVVGCCAPAWSATLAPVKAIIACETLSGAVVMAGGDPARIETTGVISAGSPTPYCEVKGYVAPAVHFELRLPITTWRQRLLFNGCGGFCGGIRIRVPAAVGCAPVENGEFVQVSSDLGHSAALSDAVWAADNPQGMRDFGSRAVHVVLLASRAIVERFYGQAPRHSYFSGCSDGGREGMMEAQRYPGDFNGIIAGAPVMNETANNTIFHAWIVQHLLARDGTPLIPEATLATVTREVDKRCGDAAGLIADPGRCRFRPSDILCHHGAASDCLTLSQARLVEAVYAGPTAPDGGRLYHGLPFGSEETWNAQARASREFATSFIRFATGMPSGKPFDLWEVGYTDADLARFNRLAHEVNATDPDLSAFRRAGGKLILWHGFTDTGVPPANTTRYVEQVRARLGNLAAFLRLYMLPGVNHCGGGRGADKLDLLSPMIAWVEDGIAPNEIRSWKAAPGTIERTVAPYAGP
ncbi:MAG: tannase/feruloyl esterase family alpha/beta hydrolase [Alphaproteobacteria bacterium]|nr:tannase/feruloyl esterase family alpha/beta hydrolase [Alphaproteobacteria bacterium]